MAAVPFADDIAMAVIRGAIVAYTGYSTGRRKEDDLAVRKKIMVGVQRGREHLDNVIETAHEAGQKRLVDLCRKTQDTIDIFIPEVDLAAGGHKFGRGAFQRSAGMGVLKKLIKFDASLIEGIDTVTREINVLQEHLFDEEEADLCKRVTTVRQHFTSLRNYFRDREDVLRKTKA